MSETKPCDVGASCRICRESRRDARLCMHSQAVVTAADVPPGSMKLLSRSPKDVRVSTEDALGLGMDAVIVLVLFVAGGYGLDRLFGTLPVFMIAMTVLGAVGVFARFYYKYEQRMAEHDEQRTAKLAGRERER